jgi:hypothetical protein
MTASQPARTEVGDTLTMLSEPNELADEVPRDRVVEEGDIYRLLPRRMLLNLNAYRGLQLINFSDVASPRVVGWLPMRGKPVEMHVVDNHAIVLLSSWRGSRNSRVLRVDLGDPANPTVVDRAFIPGYVQTSRLVRNDEVAALYVATGGYAQWQDEDGSYVWESRTVVMSFDVSRGGLEKQDQLNLAGRVADVQATTEALMVASTDWNEGNHISEVAVIDISDPDGHMVMGDSVSVAGYIRNQFNMDLYNEVLRVVSEGRWGSDRANHVQTFDASELFRITPIDVVPFGYGEDLFATIFLGNNAFFQTARRGDPFHAFYIGDDGYAREMSEFIVSGWNSFFRPVLAESRLVAIGINKESRRTMSVSLYDITKLTNPDPLLDRADSEADYSWSEASWDHRAFTVLENAVEVEAPDGDIETGLVLLPVAGWNSGDGYISGVQIFTFGEDSLTRRGMMVHGAPVRRSFQADSDLTANLSEAELSLFDTADPDDPIELGRVDLLSRPPRPMPEPTPTPTPGLPSAMN